MANIYISHSSQDKDLANEISRKLSEKGHQISIDYASLTPGDHWRTSLEMALESSDVFISLLTENSVGSQYVMTELGNARALRRRTLVIPFIYGSIGIPDVVRDIQGVFVTSREEITEAVDQIDRAIAKFIVGRAVEEKEKVETKKRIEFNAAEYIEEALSSLSVQENRNRWLGNLWYLVGFLMLVAGIAFGFYSVARFGEVTDQQWIRLAYLGLKSAIVIGLLIAGSKYAFTLGKSYMSEALKNADRSHAISFGRFYLRAFGADASWADLKEVFQHWNIDKNSSFSALDSNQFDPKFLETVLEVAKLLASKSDSKK